MRNACGHIVGEMCPVSVSDLRTTACSGTAGTPTTGIVSRATGGCGVLHETLLVAIVFSQHYSDIMANHRCTASC